MPTVAELRKKAHQHYQIASSSIWTADELLKAIAMRERIPENELEDEDYLALAIYYFDLADMKERDKRFEFWRLQSDINRAKILSYANLDLSGYMQRFASVISFLDPKEHQSYLSNHKEYLARTTQANKALPLYFPANCPIISLADEAVAMSKLLRSNAAKLSDKDAAQTYREVIVRLRKVKNLLAEQKQDEACKQRIETINKLIASSERCESRKNKEMGLFSKPATAPTRPAQETLWMHFNMTVKPV